MEINTILTREDNGNKENKKIGEERKWGRGRRRGRRRKSIDRTSTRMKCINISQVEFFKS